MVTNNEHSFLVSKNDKYCMKYTKESVTVLVLQLVDNIHNI